MELLQKAWLSESDIILAATLHPAPWQGTADRYGAIAPGFTANILIVNENPLMNIENLRNTSMVIHNGSRIISS